MKINSSVINGILDDEYQRSIRMSERYAQELEGLPKGSLLLRNMPDSNSTYIYLKYREDGKVISKYIGTTEKIDIDDLKNKIERRRELQGILRRLKAEQKDLKKLLKHG